jgi:hypothetical protein
MTRRLFKPRSIDKEATARPAPAADGVLTPTGRQLLAHELGHVVQQGGTPAAQQRAVARWPWDEPVTLQKVIPPQTVLRNTLRELFKQINGYPMPYRT